MALVILDAMNGENHISEIVKNSAVDEGNEVISFKLENMNILPCRSCGACSYKSPGKCIIKDDTHEIMKALAKCSTFIMLTPVKFGGYSSCLKKLVDKIALMALPSYFVKDGHLLHPTRYGEKAMLVAGVTEGTGKEEEDSFCNLAEHNALNLQYRFKALIINKCKETDVLKNEVVKALREVKYNG